MHILGRCMSDLGILSAMQQCNHCYLNLNRATIATNSAPVAAYICVYILCIFVYFGNCMSGTLSGLDLQYTDCVTVQPLLLESQLDWRQV